ncbi:MAG TPA: MFS transporter [Solirubrobacteraceae bacterium]|nr:MFS transporter [Solirubrobacteraceae bacterium]
MSNPQQPHPQAVSPHTNRWRAFALLAVAYFMTTVDLTIVNVSLPTIGRDLHFSETNLQWVATAYALTFGGFLLLGGRFADLLGRRRILTLGLGVFTAASLGCALAGGEAVLIAMRGAQGLGAALMIPAALSIVMNMFREGAERNRALGIWGGLGAAGGTVGLIAGGIITRYIGWQYIFYLNVPVGVAALALAPRIVPDSRISAGRRRFDLAGAISGTGGLVLLVDALSQAPQYGWGATRTIALLGASAAVLAAFIVIESRAKDPIVPLSIFRLRTLAAANLAALLLGGSFFAFVFAGTLYMQEVLHFSALQTGAAWLAGSVTSMLLAAVSQMLVTRIGAKVVMSIGMTLIGTGIVWATQVPVHAHFLANLAGPFVVAGAGTAFAFIPISVAALEGVSERQSGLASGLLNTSTQFGAAIGTAIASSVLASATNTLLRAGDAAPTALTGGFHRTFWVLAAIALIAPPATLVLRRTERVVNSDSRETQRALPATN